jgi:hypothetical protein
MAALVGAAAEELHREEGLQVALFPPRIEAGPVGGHTDLRSISRGRHTVPLRESTRATCSCTDTSKDSAKGCAHVPCTSRKGPCAVRTGAGALGASPCAACGAPVACAAPVGCSRGAAHPAGRKEAIGSRVTRPLASGGRRRSCSVPRSLDLPPRVSLREYLQHTAYPQCVCVIRMPCWCGSVSLYSVSVRELHEERRTVSGEGWVRIAWASREEEHHER